MPINFLKSFAQKLIEAEVHCQWTGELKFEKSLLKDNRLELLYQSGLRKLIFGMESYNQRVLDSMDKGCPVEVIDQTVSECIRIGIGMHLYLICGFPTETREEVLDSINFVLDNPAMVESPGFSCILSLFDLERGAPLEKKPERWKITQLHVPPNHDLALGYSYEASVGLTADEATALYQEMVKKLSEKVKTFPHNYSLSDGLLYLGYHEQENIQERLASLVLA